MNTFFSWLGNRDLDNMEQGNDAAITSLVLQSKTPFDKVVILANKDEEKWTNFEQFLKRKLKAVGRPCFDIKVYKANVENPIDYSAIAIETEKWFQWLSSEASTLAINLTSGTPAMTTLSVLYGKAKDNVIFLQSSPKNSIEQVDIPVDFGRAYFKSTSSHIAHRATTTPFIQNAFSKLTAKSAVMIELVDKAQRIASSEVPVLILGETGTGKELMANAIHEASLRAKRPFRIVNCGALSESLIDSTLFGHKKGAFTGAHKDLPGLFEQADGGTLFLDEIGEMKPDIQVKLLRALQQGEITRLGDTKVIRVDVRVIAATHQNLNTLIDHGNFREDLFYRLAVGIINMPSLRERTDDIPEVVKQLTDQINEAASKHPHYISKNISESGIKFILSQAWPGNIRELWSTLNRAFLWTDSKVIGEKELATAVINRKISQQNNDVTLSFNDKVDIAQLTENFQKKYVEAALKASGNVKKHATQMLGLKDHQTLSNWMKRLGVENEK
ncbi:sigma-54-dependent Fis family transcriptional regulator [Alteromonadaceae bacterium M269]|nr:sigma-54-dependent Fis family transcriptional regulator [Alteromonadaceae bacterium M269]